MESTATPAPGRATTTRSLPGRIFDFLSGFGLATVTLLLLGLLTWFATLEQIDNGLYPTLAKYFDWKSWWLLPEINGKTVPLPLPGGYWVCAVLLLNLILGGVIRMRKGWRHWGNLIAHFGIIFMLLGGGVAHHFSERGNMAVGEGESSNTAEDYFEYVVEVTEIKDDGKNVIHVIRGKDIDDLEGEAIRSFRFPGVPFALQLTGYLPNAVPVSAVERAPDRNQHVADGYFLMEKPAKTPPEPAEQFTAACYARPVPDGGKAGDVFILAGASFHPYTYRQDGRVFTVDMRKRLWPMPFTVKLDKFTAEFHPGTMMASKFVSNITRIENGGEAKVTIRMNEPMRYEGLTFFQASYGPPGAGPGDKMYSVFEVVRNPADKWPEWSMWIVAFGMLVTFLSKLGSFLFAGSRAKRPVEERPVKAAPQPLAAAIAPSGGHSRIGRWVAAVLALLLLLGIFANVVIDNMPKGGVRKIDGYTAWSPETLKVAETLPVQNGGRVKPFSTYAGFSMLGLHGARSMKIEDKDGKAVTVKPTAWLLDTLFRPQLAIKLPTFRIDNSDVLEAIGVKPLGRRDRYSYEDIEPARAKLLELAKSYEQIEKEKRDPVQNQTIALAYNLREYESLLGYFGFARFGITLRGSGKDGAPDQRADVSAVMMTAPEIRNQIAHAQGHGSAVSPHLQELVQQVLDASNFAKFGLAILPPASPANELWRTAGNAIYDTFADAKADPKLAIEDIRKLESVARAIGTGEEPFRQELAVLRDEVEKRGLARGEGEHLRLEVHFYERNWFLNALAFFILGTLTALAMWTVGGRPGRVLTGITWIATGIGAALCVIAIVQRCIIMQRPPVGNLYDTIIFIAATSVLFSMVVEWMTRRRFALGVAPILGALLILLARRYEVGDPKDNMNPLVAVLNSNYWLATHVITISLGYSAGLLSAFLSFLYLLMRGLGLDNGDRDIRRSFTRAVYGMLCLTLFLSLVGTVLGGVWANDSWGRFWGWDPKENGALLIVLWMLAILHARLGGFLREWGLHLAAVFTGAVVAFSWWHVNFLGVGLHNYGFTAGKDTIWRFYAIIVAILVFGTFAWSREIGRKSAAKAEGNA